MNILVFFISANSNSFLYKKKPTKMTLKLNGHSLDLTHLYLNSIKKNVYYFAWEKNMWQVWNFAVYHYILIAFLEVWNLDFQTCHIHSLYFLRSHDFVNLPYMEMIVKLLNWHKWSKACGFHMFDLPLQVIALKIDVLLLIHANFIFKVVVKSINQPLNEVNY